MGKQSRKRQRDIARFPSSSLLQSAKTSAPVSPHPEVSPTPQLSVRDEIDESLAKIYESFFQEFSKRIPERKASPDPLEAHPPQHSVLDKKVQERLVDRVRTLTRAIGCQDVYALFQARTSDFIYKLLEAVKAAEDERLSLGLLEDSYEIMENAIEVVEGLIQLYGSEGSQVIMQSGKNEFYELVLHDAQLKDLLEKGSLMESQRDQLIYQTLGPADEMNEEICELRRKAAQQETFQRMSIEELVTYINDTPKSARRGKVKATSGLSTADGSKSPNRSEEVETEDDREVELFREKLESCNPARKKVLPKLSEAWLRRLKLLSESSSS